MTFIINEKEKIISNYINSITMENPQLIKHPNIPLVYQKNRNKQNVPILCGGGSGHEPAHIGYVGKGMLNAALFGDIFVPPSTEDILEAIHFLDSGKGVFIIIKNFEADINSFRKAIDIARKRGHQVKYVISHDDISIEPKKKFQIRGKGLAGTILLHKILGYYAQNGSDLNELEAIGFELSTQIATIGFATKSATLPKTLSPLFDLNCNEISYGIGIHGEEGYRTAEFQSSEVLANEIINKLKMHYHWEERDKYILLVNNLGTATDLEMGNFLNDIVQLLEIEGIDLKFIKTGKFMTSLDMAGISVTLCRASNLEWIEGLQSATDAFAW